MKLLLLPLLLLAGAGGYGLAASPTEETPACDPADCRITVECTERGTCIVTCFDENGDVQCQREVECDGPCDEPGDKPCDKPCEPSQSCAR